MVSSKDRLLEKAQKVAPKTTKAKKVEREIVILDKSEQIQMVDRICSASNVKKAMEGHEKANKSAFGEIGFLHCLKSWIKNGHVTENPQFQTPSGSSFIYQMKDTISKFRCPRNNEGNLVKMGDHLASKNIPEKMIDRLIKENEFVEETTMTIPIADIEKKKPELADKLFELILMASEEGVKSCKSGKKVIKFDAEEIKQILQYNNDVTIKDGFMDRMVSHCKAIAPDDDEEALKLLQKLTDVFPPTPAYSSVSPGKDNDEIIKKMITEKPKEAEANRKESHDIGDFNVNVEVRKISIVRKRDGKEMATKDCKDNDHVNNTIKQWQRDTTTLDAYILSNG